MMSLGGRSLAAIVGMAAGLAWMTPAQAVRFEYGGIQASWENRLILGAGWRLEERDESLVGKLNVNPDLCPDDCLSFSGDPAPNQRLVDAPGSFVGSNYDNGNLNYDRGDFISGQSRIESELKGFWGDVAFKVSGIGFYDEVNESFDDFNPDTAFQPRFSERAGPIKERVGADIDLLEAFVSVPFQAFGMDFNISVGEQRIRWGESTFVALGSLDQLNPPNENRLRFPGAQIASVFEPTGLAVLTTNFTPNLSAELVYQYHWERVQPTAEGSFFATNDFAGGGDYAVVGLGQFSEDPNQIGTFKTGTAQLITSTSNSVPVDSTRGEPSDSGQGGLRLNYYAEDVNGGTDFGLYALNYHSRLPYGSVQATDRSCLRDRVDLPDGGDLPGVLQPIVSTLENTLGQQLSADGVTALVACQGFNGSLTEGTGLGREPLPLDTLGVFLDYPEDIHLFGASFTTQFGAWSLAGEYAFRPNMPLQVSIPDVVFAGLQPALPDQDINLAIATIPSARNAVPDFISTRYRNNPVEANEIVRGYERFQVQQLDLTGIRVFSSSNPIGADQIIWLLEGGITHVIDHPDRSDLQLDGGGPNCTHASPGADGTGAAGPDARRLNPTQAGDCFADQTSYGWRTLVQATYNDLLFGWNVNPLLFFFHDIDGVAPFPAQNFVEGRKRLILGTEIQFSQSIQGQVMLETYWGTGDRRISLRDRDNISLALEYNF